MIEIDKLRAADRRTLGRAITLIESSRHDHRSDAEELLEAIMPYTGQSLRIGITGAPGVGKSTFIDTFGCYALTRGHKVAVLSIDPSSSISGGSILGDKTRMENLALSDQAYIRPSPAGTTLGGVARRTREALLVCEAAGFDLVIVETVGVGQSETLVAGMTDVFLLLLLPGSGDDLQGIKRGIMELADIVVVNKADGDLVQAAKRTSSDVSHALELMRPRIKDWKVPVLTASALNRSGIAEVFDGVERYRKVIDEDGLLKLRRGQQSADCLWQETGEILLEAMRSRRELKAHLTDLQQQVREGKVAPSVAARKLAETFLDLH